MQTQKPRTKQELFSLTLCGVMSALAIVLALLIHFPIFPAVAFLEYDAGDIPIFLLSMIAGPVWGSLAAIAAAIIQGTTVSAASGIIGILMNILSTCSFVWANALLLRLTKGLAKKRPFLHQTIALIGGLCGLLLAMTVWNIIVTPFYMGVPRGAVIALLPWILLFNAIKGIINGICALLLWRATQSVFRSAKK